MSASKPGLQVLVGLVVTALFVGVVQSRTDASGLFVGAEGGAVWAEHVERLAVVTQTRTLGPAQGWGDLQSLGTWLSAIDRRFPPGLYLWGTLVGDTFGHDAVTICRSMSVWWVLLALAAGVVAFRIAPGRRGAFLATYCATLALPGFGSLGLTFFFDLPMVAMIWLAMAAWMLLDRWPPLAGLVAGVLLFGAGLVKWTGLPIGGLMLACVAFAGFVEDRRTGRVVWVFLGLVIAAATMTAAFVGWQRLGGQSFAHMMQITSGAKVSAHVTQVELGTWTLTLVDWEARRLIWYGLRVVTQILGPLVALPLLVAAAVGARGRVAWLLALMVVLHVLFYLLLVPPKDARFLMSAAPALSIAAALGWLRLGRRGGLLAGLTLLLALVTLFEFHHGRPGRWNGEWPIASGPDDPWSARSLFLDVGDRLTAGWPKARAGTPFLSEREVLWEGLIACEGPEITIATDSIGSVGDAPWWAYRDQLARMRSEPRPRVRETWQPWGSTVADEMPADGLLLLGSKEGPPNPGPDWSPRGWLVASDREIGLFGRGDGPQCDLGSPLPVRRPRLACAPPSTAGPAIVAAKTGRAAFEGGGAECWDVGVGCTHFYEAAAKRLTDDADCGPLLAELRAAREEDQSDDASASWSEGEGWDAARLSDELRSRLAVPEPGPIRFWQQDIEPTNGRRPREFVLEDSLFGLQRLVVFLPDGAGPHPTVVGLLGHGQSVDGFMDEHAGQQLLDAGVAVVVPVVRAYDSGSAEDRATRAMLCAGSSMVAARIAEVRNVLRFVRSQSEFCGDRVALLGHSGGSLVVNVMTWVEPDLKAVVTDMEGHYNGAREQEPLAPHLRDETHLGLRSLSKRLIDFADAPTPTLRVHYGMPKGPESVVPFLKEALWSDELVPQPPPLPPPQ